MTLNLPLI